MNLPNKGPLLVFDCHYLCHRAYHTTGELEWKGVATGVVFGFLKAVLQMQDEFHTNNVAFCFEGGNLHRAHLYSAYKQKRNLFYSPEEEKRRGQLADQIRRLRTEYLPEIGYRNVFYYPGFESDDIMAALAQETPEDQETILVTGDYDLFQCLRPNVSVYAPQRNKLFTEHWFRKTYGIAPSKWAVVKALSGCHTDNVAGIKGVGEKTALKFLRGETHVYSKTFELIRCPQGRALVRFNRKLVQLPFDGCPVPQLRKDNIDKKAWRQVCERLGMRSIARK